MHGKIRTTDGLHEGNTRSEDRGRSIRFTQRLSHLVVGGKQPGARREPRAWRGEGPVSGWAGDQGVMMAKAACFSPAS